jgi:hypothetical protein
MRNTLKTESSPESENYMTGEEVDKAVEEIFNRMFRRRLNQRNPYDGWNQVYEWNNKPVRDLIREHILAGHKVTSGYYATSVRGWHDHVIFWKESKQVGTKPD